LSPKGNRPRATDNVDGVGTVGAAEVAGGAAEGGAAEVAGVAVFVAESRRLEGESCGGVGGGFGAAC